jgi:hypothetical protein
MPALDGYFEIRIRVTDAVGCTAQGEVSITIDKAGIELPPVDLSRNRPGR